MIFLNDRLVPENEAVVSVFDHGFLYGDGVYETMRAYDGMVFMLDRHLGRLERSASMIRLKTPPPKFIAASIYDTLKACALRNAYIRITVSRGKGPIGLDPALCPAPTFVVIAEEFKNYPEKYYSEGVALITAHTRRNLRAAIDPQIKSLNFLNNILAKIEAKDRGAYEAIMLNSEGFIAEGTISNIFFAAGGTVFTPARSCGILDGITRELVMNVARSSGLKVEEGEYRPDDLYAASEVFITNTTSEVMPVSSVDGRKFNSGGIAAKLRILYGEEVGRHLSSTV